MKIYLETARIILRNFDLNDEQNLFELDSDPEVMRFLTNGVPSTRENIRAALGRILDFYEKYEERFGFWAAIEKSSGQFMGWFHFRPGKNDLENLDRIELGYRLKKLFWGKGYATEGSRALVAKGFGELGLSEVFATTMKDNLASQKVMEKAGLVLVKEYPSHRVPGVDAKEVEYLISKARRSSPSDAARFRTES